MNLTFMIFDPREGHMAAVFNGLIDRLANWAQVSPTRRVVATVATLLIYAAAVATIYMLVQDQIWTKAIAICLAIPVVLVWGRVLNKLWP